MGGASILSQEGTTQGDPLAMPLCALSTVPLIRKLSSVTGTKQVWYADDSAAVGSVSDIKQWWDALLTRGPSYGYHVNVAKSWLVVKEGAESVTCNLFKDSQINVTTEGRQYLGAPVGRQSFIQEFVSAKVDHWKSILLSLADISSSSPHAAYAAFTHGIASLWLFLCRTTPNICHLLQPLKDVIRVKLTSGLTGRSAPSDLERRLFSLPVRLGGLHLIPPTALHCEFSASQKLTAPLTALLADQSSCYSVDVLLHQVDLRRAIGRERQSVSKSEADRLLPDLSEDLRHAVLLAQEKVASSWPSALPIRVHGFSLHKGAFRDAIALLMAGLPVMSLWTVCVGTSLPLNMPSLVTGVVSLHLDTTTSGT